MRTEIYEYIIAIFRHTDGN